MAMANFNTTHSVILFSVLLSLFSLHTCNNNNASKGDEISEERALQGRDGKYVTPCIESFICNDSDAPEGVHLGHCWCCIFKGKCYSSEFICTVLCILPSHSAANNTSDVP